MESNNSDDKKQLIDNDTNIIDEYSGRRANQEEEIFSLWDKFGCKEKPLNSGKVIAFLNQIK